MTSRQILLRAITVALGAQALAFAALAQQPDTAATQRADDATSATDSPTSSTRTDTERRLDAAEQDESTLSRTRMSDSSKDRSTMDHAGADHSKMTPVTPQAFATKAAVMSRAEIELAQLALENTKNEEVRLYAERMVKDHTASSNKLKEIASKENLQLPQSLDAKHQNVKQQMARLKGDAFDREYKKHMNTSHDEAVALFESASQTQQMPDELKSFAASTLPTLERHKKLAEGLDAGEGA